MSENKPLWIKVSTGQGNSRHLTKWIPDTTEAIEKATVEGYPWQSHYKYEYPPEAGKVLPLMQGDFSIVFSYPVRKQEYLALGSTRIFIDEIIEQYGVPLDMFRIYMDTSGTVSVFINKKIYGGDFPSVRLWLLQRNLLESICNILPECKVLGLHYPDDINIPIGLNFDELLVWGVYRPNPEVFFLPPGLESNGVHTVRLSPDDIFVRQPEDIWKDICDNIQSQLPEYEPKYIEDIGKAYEQIAFPELPKQRLEKRISSLLQCEFGKRCLEEPSKLMREQVEPAIALLACLGNYGLEKSLKLSEYFSDLTSEWIKSFFDRISFMDHTPTCMFIKQRFDCGKRCEVDAPLFLPWNPEVDEEKAKCYKEKGDGLYYSPSAWENDDDSVKLCSPLFIVARTKDVNELKWGKKVKYNSPNGNVHNFTVLMRD